MQQQALVYVSAFSTGSDGAIHAYSLDLESGQLRLLERTTDVEQPFFMALSPCRRFLFTNHSPGTFGGSAHEEMAAFKIAEQGGQLHLINRQSTRGTATCFCEVDATGRTLVIANYTTGSVAAFPIAESGWLDEISAFIPHHGASIDPLRQTSPHAHCAVISPDNRFVLIADLGLDQLLAYRLDAASSQLTPAPRPFVDTAPGAGPRHLIFHPNGRHVYAINELNNTVTVYGYDSQSATLTPLQTIATLPADYAGESFCADLKITPDGRWLYCTNRGHDSIVTYRVGDDGRLTWRKTDASLGERPQNLAITPSGDWLLCANMPGQNVAVFKIDQQSGGISSVGQPVSMPNPSCIVIV